MKEIFTAIKKFLGDRFNLTEDKADEKSIVENITKDTNFKGAPLWTLIFAIMIASIGLNVNSTAVIIGAMLISPIMGPIMGIGLAVGINDIDFLKSGIKNFLIAAVISIITSTIYFSITPLHDTNSELLARTNPSLWDVFIAFFGGLAGIVAGTRTRISNVIPGVAIATALMPPLCTAGFGLATGQLYYFLGALYLFFINGLFICLATFLVVTHLRFRKKQFTTKSNEKKVTRTIWIVVTIAILPSIYLAYRITERSIFETNARKFVQKEFSFAKSQVLNKTFKIEKGKKYIELLVVGEELSKHTVDSIEKRLATYGLAKTKLIVFQGLNAKQQIDISQIKASLMEEVFKKEATQDTEKAIPANPAISVPDIRLELKSLYPEMIDYSLSKSIFYNLDSAGTDTLMVMNASFRTPISTMDQMKLKNWIKQRTKFDSVKLFISEYPLKINRKK